MGTCNCMASTTKGPEEDISPMNSVTHAPAQSMVPVEVSGAEVDVFHSTVDAAPDFSALSHAFRVREARQRLLQIQSELVEIESVGGTEHTEDSDVDPRSLLSREAREVVEKEAPVSLEKRVRGVVIRPARRLADGNIYVGEWSAKSHTRKGRGRLYQSDGSLLEGYWRGGNLCLYGRVVFSSGDYYIGDFVNGKQEGSGVFVSAGNRLEGQWKDGVMHGKGVEIMSDGSRYEGDFSNGQKTGRGAFRWADGSWYNGDLANGQLEGSGEYYWADGRRYSGQWKSGQMNGKGKFYWPDGKTYDGEYVLDKKEGFGVYVWDQKVYEGQWKNNKMHGLGYLTAPGKERKQYEFQEGNKVREVAGN